MTSRPAFPPEVGLSLPIDWLTVEEEAANLLSRYIQFDTSNPPGSEAAAVEFLAQVLRERGFTPQVIESAPGRANLIVRLPGQGHELPCLLYAHADVVPAEAEGWSYPPFSGQISDGFVWGRGALDDKALGIIFLQALTLLKQFVPPLNRDIILLIAADEESCGHYGVAWLLDHHPDLVQAGYVWDEGGVGLSHPVTMDQHLFTIAVAEKGPLTVKLVAHGTQGHASTPRPDNPLEQLVQTLARLKNWQRPARLTETVREMLHLLAPVESFPRSILFAHADNLFLGPLLRLWLQSDPLFSPLMTNTVSLTMLRGGQKSNIIPAQAEATLDIRLLPGEDPAAVVADLRSFVGAAPVSVQLEDTPIPHLPSSTETDFYRNLAKTLQAVDPASLVIPYLTPGATDSRFFRRAGMQAYGFLPMLLNAEELSRIHGVNERVSTANLCWGIQVVVETLRKF